MLSGFMNGLLNLAKVSSFPVRRLGRILIHNDRPSVCVGGLHDQIIDGARLFRDLSYSIKRCCPKRPAQVEVNVSQTPVPGFENQHAGIKRIERALCALQTIKISPHLHAGWRGDIHLGHTRLHHCCIRAKA